MKKFQLGQKAKDKVSGFEGILTARVEYLNGCVQYALKPRVEANATSIPDAFYIDEQQIEITGPGITVEAKPTGGPQADQPKY